MLMKAQVLSEEHLDRAAPGEKKEMATQYLRAGLKKSAHASSLGKREVPKTVERTPRKISKQKFISHNP